MEACDTVKHLSMHRAYLIANNYLTQSVNYVEVDKFRFSARKNAKIRCLLVHKILFKENAV